MFQLILWIALSLAASEIRAEPFAYPKTRPGNLARELLGLCEAPDVGKLNSWLTLNLSASTLKEMPADDLARMMADLCAFESGYEPLSVKKSGPLRLTLEVRGRKSHLWSELFLDLDDKGQLHEPIVSPIIPPESSLPKDLSDAVIARELHSEVDRLGKLDLFSGVVLLARGTQLIASATTGYADREIKKPIHASSQFTLASLSKMFTAVAVGQLVDQKKLSFDDKVGKFFPNYPNKIVRDQVTVGMLLSHCAGMGFFLDKRTPSMMKNGVQRAEEFLPVLAQEELLYPPGARQDYSNSGLVLAGAIVEKVSGVDYPVYIRKYIFEPSGMLQSHPNNVPQAFPNLVKPYTRIENKWQLAKPDLGSPAGGAISTAEDLVRFADALRKGKLISQETLAQLKKPRSPEAGAPRYGYGMYNREIHGFTMVGHGGGTSGVSTHLALLLEAPYTVVVLENIDLPIDFSWKARALMAAKARWDK